MTVASTPRSAAAQAWSFTDVTVDANVRYKHGYLQPNMSSRRATAAGVAAGDYDNDGWIDLFMVGGDRPNVLLHNLGDGTFEDATADAGLSGIQGIACGPLFTDLNGDGWLDLVMGGIEGSGPTLLLNTGAGTFEDATINCGITTNDETFSVSAGDYDRDGDLDLFLAHWWGGLISCSRLWQNQGDATFTCVDEIAGTRDPRGDLAKFGYTPNFVDINSDGWPDILLSSDFETSQVFLSNGDGTFTDITDEDVMTDQNGMGGAIGDYDNDGDLDWFVTSIWDPQGIIFPLTGNRMYKNDGNGNFTDVTDEAGVRQGGWGWGASFADFNNDGHLDLYHVNGWPLEKDIFKNDPARLFISNGDGTFTERSGELGAQHLGQGRGVVCFDYDRDGDLDIFVVATGDQCYLYRNDGGNAGNYLGVKLTGDELNSDAIGARIYATVGNATQMRELRSGSNFESQNPAEAHFGLDDASVVDELRVVWPDGATVEMSDVPANQLLKIDYPEAEPPPPPVYKPRIVDIGPNPSATRFAFGLELPAGANGALVIYDVSGRVVRRYHSLTSAGPSPIIWQGTDEFGNRVASGIYFVRLETTSGMSETKRVVLVR